MANCSFCGRHVEQGTGKIVIAKTGKMLWFDSSKCEKNSLKLQRDARKFKWTNAEKSVKS